ncbi:hypothetical protein [Mucilaginibacter sp.]|uniref:hypothetical protein n=1 Tax=Mucilaginibacter sp. TaxID=1882438 RepID=UPI0025FB7FE2|nr:hypothetical protein [Mucilaginibacter sp.]
MHRKNIFYAVIGLLCLNGIFNPVSAQKKPGLSLATLKQGQTINGFKAVAVYLNDADKPMGGRFIQVATGFTLDLLQVESVPQTFIYANTFPVSEKGEPHTQEHLLITKGSKGHLLNTREDMSLAESNAFTSQLHTAYHFNTGGGPEVFYTLFESYLDALLHPDYTSEEVSREVRNWGITQNPDKTLRLEEKGSVYNEMSSGMNNPYALLFDELGRLQYGPNHPNSYNAGGLPAGIRVLNATDIAAYHKKNYYLGNMGAITSLPKNMQLSGVLSRTNAILSRLSKGSKSAASANKLPPPHPAENGKMEAIEYPTENEQQPGTVYMSFPPALKLSTIEYIKLNNFLNVFAGDATTNLYKIFVDSKTKITGFDAQSVFAYVDFKQGDPVTIGLDGVSAENLTNDKVTMARNKVIDELKRVAAFPDHSPELLEFNKRFASSLLSSNRSDAKFVNSPPKFGFRNTGDNWYVELQVLEGVPGFTKSVMLKPQMVEVRRELATGINIWKPLLAKLDLDHTLPLTVYSKANPALLKNQETARKIRAEIEVARLKDLYKIDNDQDAIKRYKAVYDSNTMVLEKLEQAGNIKFIEHPPLTLDDELVYKRQVLANDVPAVASVFDNMTSATTGLAISLKGIPKDKLVYLAVLPDLLTATGIIKDGKAISYEDMIQLVQQQILSINSYYGTNGKSGRAELVISAAGNNQAEALKAVEWMGDVLQNPNWTTVNLPRLRDLVDQELTGIRKTMQGAEESWVNNPQRSYLYQNRPLLLATTSFLTRTFNIFRLKWMLKDSGSPADATALNAWLGNLASAQNNRGDLKKLLRVLNSTTAMSADSAGTNKQLAEAFNQLPTGAKAIAKNAAQDLEQILNDIPDNSLAADWKMVCKTLQHDLAQPPEQTLAELNNLRKMLLNTTQARVFMVGSASTEDKLGARLNNLFAGFSHTPLTPQSYPSAGLIDARVMARMNMTAPPVYAGLIAPDMHNGVFINTAPIGTYKDTGRVSLLKFLAAGLYGGGGKQSVYTKTTGAGLSYSTGVGANPGSGRFLYYAERTPELPQTLRFVIDEIKRSPVDTGIMDYIVSGAVGGFRSAGDYETRGEAMANDLADGNLPENIKTFRLAILKLRKEPGIINKIYGYKDEVYQIILPGYGKPSKDLPGGNYFVIGPEKQMQAYETYLKSVDGAETTLYRLYPRDFWMVDGE